METINANYDNEMERIIRDVPADYSKFSLLELYKLHLAGCYNIESKLNEININMKTILNENIARKKRDKFLIAMNAICGTALLFVLLVEFFL